MRSNTPTPQCVWRWERNPRAVGVNITVRDFGIGIAAVHIKRLSQRFYRVPDPAVRSRRGTGLGLFVVASHVRSLGGRMVARSQGRGKGATFSVWLPLGQKEHS